MLIGSFWLHNPRTGYTIENAIMLDGGADYLVRDPSSAGNRKTFTFSCWLKRSAIGSQGGTTGNNIFGGDRASGSGHSDRIMFGSADDGNDWLETSYHDGSSGLVKTNALYRDPTAWMNIVWVVDTTQSTDTNRVKVYVNGSLVTFNSPSYPAEDYLTAINNTENQAIGVRPGTLTQQHFGGYMAEVILLDGTAESDASKFGELDDNGVWVPIEPSGLTFGTNGFHLKFDDANNPGKSSAPSTAASVSYVSTGTTDTSANSYTFSSQNIGTAASDRWVVVAATTYNTGRSVQSLTIGGTNATKIVEAKTPSGNSATVAIYALQVSSGTSADIVVDYGGAGQISCGIMVWNVNSSSGSWNTATDTDESDPLTASVSVNDGGVVIAASAYAGGTAPTNVVWAELTENNDAVVESSPSPFWQSGASKAYTSGQTVNISANHDNTQSQLNLAAAVFNADGDNSFANNSITSTQQVTDTPTDDADNDIGNYATWNPLTLSGGTLSEGNTKFTASGASQGCLATVGASSGKYFAEATLTLGDGVFFGVKPTFASLMTTASAASPWNQQQNLYFAYLSIDALGGNIIDPQTASAISDQGAGSARYSVSSGDTIGCLLDLDDYDVRWYKLDSGSWVQLQKTGAANATVDLYPAGHQWTFVCRGTNGSDVVDTNFGQTAFSATPPDSAVAMNTADLPAPTVTDPSKYFASVVYTGDNNNNRNITGFQDAAGNNVTPDLVWIKGRSNATSHYLQDAVREFGGSKELMTDANSVEGSQATGNGYIGGVVPGGFTAVDGGTNDVYVNENGRTYVAWMWKAGDSNTAVSESGSGSGAVNACTHRANTTSGFSIIKYTGFNDTISNGEHTLITHGLGSPPVIMIGKSLDSSQDWFVMPGVPGTMGSGRWGLDNHMHLNTVDASDGSKYVQPAFPTSTAVKIGNDDLVNKANDEFIMYAFIRVAGLMGYGTYNGNGSTDGPFIQVDDNGSGFKPAWIMIKNITSAGNWFIYDNQRNPYNVTNTYLIADGAAAEASSGPVQLDFIANGFKLRSTNDGTNGGSDTYVYLAFAESPFGGDGVAQAKAR